MSWMTQETHTSGKERDPLAGHWAEEFWSMDIDASEVSVALSSDQTPTIPNFVFQNLSPCPQYFPPYKPSTAGQPHG